MPYNKIATIGQFTTPYQTTDDCNIMTMDNCIYICDDIEIEDYTGQTILTLSDPLMFPDKDTFSVIPITLLKTNLLQNSEHLDITLAPFNNSTIVKVNNTTFDGETYWYCNFNQNRYVQVDFPTLEIGEKYYFSFEAARTPEATSQIIQHEIQIDGVSYYGGALINGQWKRTVVEFTATATSTSAKILLGYASQTTNLGGYFRHFYLGKWDTEWFNGQDIPFNTLEIVKLDNNGNLSIDNNIPKAILRTNGMMININNKYYNPTIGNIYADYSSPFIK